MANIGNLAFKVSADASGMTKTLGAASGAVSSFAAQTQSVLASAFSKTAFGAIGKSSGLSGLFASLKSGIIGAVIGGLGMAPDFWAKQIERIKELTKVGFQAQALGIDSGNFMGLTQNAARFGLEIGDVTKALAKMAAMKAPPVGVNIGLDEWTKRDAAYRFETVAHAIKGLGDANLAASMSSDIFGKKAYKLQPLLAQGGEAIQEYTQKMIKLGRAVGEADMAKLMRARAALGKMGGVVEGFQNKLTIAAAPLIELFANQFEKFMPMIMNIVDGSARAIATWFAVIGEFWKTAFDYYGQLYSKILDTTGALFDFKDQFGSIEFVVKTVLKGIAYAFAYTFDTIKAGWGAWLAGIGMGIASLGQIMKKLGGAETGNAWIKAGTNLAAMGAVEVANWGDTAKGIDAFFERAFRKSEAITKEAEKTAQVMYQATHVAVEGSAAANAIVARFQTQGIGDPKIAAVADAAKIAREQLIEQKRQAAEAERARVAMEKILDHMREQRFRNQRNPWELDAF